MKKRLEVRQLTVQSIDLSNPKKIDQANTEIIKKREVADFIIIDKEIFEIRKEKVNIRRERMLESITDAFRNSAKAFFSSVILDAFMSRSNKVTFLLISTIVLGLIQSAFLALDIYCLRKVKEPPSEVKSKLRFASARLVKNFAIALICVVISTQLASDNLSKWILPIEILLVLYFVVIIYFVINSGSIRPYYDSIIFNLILFIECFFVQRDTAYLPNKESHFLSEIWIYDAMIGLFGLALLVHWYHAARSLSHKEKKLKGKVYLLLGIDTLSVVLCMICASILMKSDSYDPAKVTVLSSTTVLAFGLTVASFLTQKHKIKLANDYFDAMIKTIDQEAAKADKIEEKIETARVPYYMVPLTKGFFKPADKYDLLKLATHRNQSTTQDRGIKNPAPQILNRKITVDELPPLQRRGEEVEEGFPQKDEAALVQQPKPKKVYLFGGVKNKFTDKPSSSPTKKYQKDNTERSYQKSRVVNEDRVNTSLDYSSKTGKTKNTKDQCLICFDREPNCVIMPCGHGGICLKCGLDIWSASATCFLCKAPVDSILQIDPEPVAGMCKVMHTIVQKE